MNAPAGQYTVETVIISIHKSCGSVDFQFDSSRSMHAAGLSFHFLQCQKQKVDLACEFVIHLIELIRHIAAWVVFV